MTRRKVQVFIFRLCRTRFPALELFSSEMNLGEHRLTEDRARRLQRIVHHQVARVILYNTYLAQDYSNPHPPAVHRDPYYNCGRKHCELRRYVHAIPVQYPHRVIPGSFLPCSRYYPFRIHSAPRPFIDRRETKYLCSLQASTQLNVY